MTPKELFQTGIRITGIVFLYFSIPRALGDLATLADSLRGQPFFGFIGLVFRIAWEIAVPIWLVRGAPALTRGLFGSE